MPDQAYVKFKYRTIMNLVAGVGNAYIIDNYSGNSLYDPYQTGIGDQPTGFDQWAAFYDSYHVTGSKLKILVNNETPSSIVAPNSPGHAILFTVFPSTAVYVSGSLTTRPPDEQPMAINKWMGSQFVNGSPSRARVKAYMTTNKMYAQPGTKVDQDFTALVSANPAKQWYWNLVFQDAQGATTDRLFVTGYVEITYYAIMKKRQWLANS